MTGFKLVNMLQEVILMLGSGRFQSTGRANCLGIFFESVIEKLFILFLFNSVMSPMPEDVADK